MWSWGGWERGGETAGGPSDGRVRGSELPLGRGEPTLPRQPQAVGGGDKPLAGEWGDGELGLPESPL